MKFLVPMIALLLLGGCTTPPSQVSSAPNQPTATIKGSSSNPVDFFLGNDAECRIQAIDGVKVGPNDRLLPGNHILTVTLRSTGKDYSAKVNLIIPGAKSYQLKAKRKDDAFTLWLVDEEASKSVATSTAPIKERMEFLVFVVQK